MKFLAETTGEFMLMDLSTGTEIQPNRPTVVVSSAFLTSRIALGQVSKVMDLPDEATDDEFAQFWLSSDGDRELAVASFASKFDPAATKPVAPKSAKKGK